MSKEFPRRIDASTIEIGDTISVTRNLGNGVTQTLKGTVATRADVGMVRTYRTEEGGVIVTWSPDRTVPRVLLLSRKAYEQQPLWSETAGLPDRVRSDNGVAGLIRK